MDNKYLYGLYLHYRALFNTYSDMYTAYLYIDVDGDTIRSISMLIPGDEIKQENDIVYTETILKEVIFYGDEKALIDRMNKYLYNKLVGKIVTYGFNNYITLVNKSITYGSRMLYRFITIPIIFDLSYPVSLYMYKKYREFKVFTIDEAISIILNEKNDEQDAYKKSIKYVNYIKMIYDILKEEFMDKKLASLFTNARL
ncbi:MAG: hypothetical protein ACP5GJ_02575 [Nanopusillaceae archaeon]